METKEIKINVPEGYEIDQENSTFECIKFKPVKKELPKTWEEFCKTHPRKVGECYITGGSGINTIEVTDGLAREQSCDRNLLPSKELAEAVRALCQLIQLRDCYNDGWKPDWNTRNIKYCIEICKNNIEQASYCITSRVLAFKSEELRNQFLENFRDLIEIAKPLL